MVGVLGLAFDLGRTFVAKSELQNYTDAAAIGGGIETRRNLGRGDARNHQRDE